jgi:hypothetical protein
LLLALFVPASAEAQPAPLQGARLATRASQGLARELRALQAASREPGWIGWSVPASQRGRICCFSQRRPRAAACRLEDDNGFSIESDRAGMPGAESVDVLLRLEAGRVSRVKLLSPDCAADTQGRALLWLSDVPSEESLALLRGLTASRDRGLAEDALAAVALHAGDAALEALLELARDRERDLRGEALFWLAQRATQRAVGEIRRAIDADPDTEIMRQAVFAVSELPRERGVPLLIELARTHSNPAVREQAFFWLGQSEDERALAFFEDVLLR